MKSTGAHSLKTEIWGNKLSSPVGLAAGLDKNGEIIDPLFGLGMIALLTSVSSGSNSWQQTAPSLTSIVLLFGDCVAGFGFVEIGSVTPMPQEGNPKPRVFRLLQDNAVINRYGFNSHGASAVRPRLAAWRSHHPFGSGEGMLGVNLGKNKTTENAADDYVKGMLEIGELGDYLVVNVSSPNTPGLRSLQASDELEKLITRLQTEKAQHVMLKHKPLVVKIAPDLSQAELEDIARVCLDTKVDGLIISNTTTSRPPSLTSQKQLEAGGLSGHPLKDRSMELLREMRRLTKGNIKLISTGGVETAEDVYQRLRAGASLVQLYTALTFAGPGLIAKINDDLVELLHEEGVSSVSSIIGKDAL